MKKNQSPVDFEYNKIEISSGLNSFCSSLKSLPLLFYSLRWFRSKLMFHFVFYLIAHFWYLLTWSEVSINHQIYFARNIWKNNNNEIFKVNAWCTHWKKNLTNKKDERKEKKMVFAQWMYKYTRSATPRQQRM